MGEESRRYTCSRCGTAFPMTARHTEIVRRDFVEVPRPSRVERLCADCWTAYVEEFLGRDLDAEMESYGVER